MKSCAEQIGSATLTIAFHLTSHLENAHYARLDYY
jgi:hypothetical protein